MENDPKSKKPQKPRNRTYYFREYRKKKRAAVKAVNATVTTNLNKSLDKLDLLKGEIAGSVSANTQELLEESTSVAIQQITARLTTALLTPILTELRSIREDFLASQKASPVAPAILPHQMFRGPNDPVPTYESLAARETPGFGAPRPVIAVPEDPEIAELDAFLKGPINRPSFTPNRTVQEPTASE